MDISLPCAGRRKSGAVDASRVPTTAEEDRYKGCDGVVCVWVPYLHDYLSVLKRILEERLDDGILDHSTDYYCGWKLCEHGIWYDLHILQVINTRES